jgi:hypothetical protein
MLGLLYPLFICQQPFSQILEAARLSVNYHSMHSHDRSQGWCTIMIWLKPLFKNNAMKVNTANHCICLWQCLFYKDHKKGQRSDKKFFWYWLIKNYLIIFLMCIIMFAHKIEKALGSYEEMLCFGNLTIKTNNLGN